MNRGDRAGDFERWLDRELPGAIGAELRAAVPPPSPAARATPSGARGVARLGARAAAAAAFVAALAVAGGGAAVATGRPNPVSWGQQMVQVVWVGPAPRTPVPTPEAPSSRPAAPSSRGAHGQPASGVAGAGASDASPGTAKHQGDPEASPAAGQDQQSQGQQSQGQQSQSQQSQSQPDQGHAVKTNGHPKGQNQNP